MGGEKALNIYIQFFRYRVNKGDVNQHVIITSLSQLRQFTNQNMSRRMSIPEIKNVLARFEKLGLIKIHSKALRYTEAQDLIILEIERVKDNDYYFLVDFDIINYLYNKNKFRDTTVMVYLMLNKLSNGVEGKAFMSIFNITKTLNTGTRKVLTAYGELNRAGVVATIPKKRHQGPGSRFEHLVCKRFDEIEEFKSTHKNTIDKFIERSESYKRTVTAAY